MDLQQARSMLDQIDRQITTLFCRRMDIIREIASYKIKNSLPVYDPAREEELLEQLKSLATDGWQEQVVQLYQQILSISRQTQKDLGAR